MVTDVRLAWILLTLLSLVSVVRTQDGETITIQNKSHIICVYENNDSPIYFDPPVISELKTQSIILEGEGWNVKKSSDSFQGPVEDKRWEDFPTHYTDNLIFTPTISKAFSIFTNKTLSIEFYIEIENIKESSYFQVDLEKVDEWIHFTFLMKNDSVYIFQNDVNIRMTPAANPKKIIVVSSENAYWKTHDYKWASSTSEGTDSLTVEENDKSCLIFYTSLCSTCSLDISDSNNFQLTVLSSDNESDTILQSWRSHIFPTDRNEKNEITIVRKVTGNVEKGYWELDIRSCSTIINDKTVFEIKTPETEKNIERKCYNLNNQMGQRIRRKRELNEARLFNCDEPGILGIKCDLRCTDILGEGSPYCEQHRICRNSTCLCSWGFGGSSCDEACHDGTWGMSCEKKCAGECNRPCNKITGVCQNNVNENLLSLLGTVMIAFVVVIVLIVSLRSLSRKLKRSEQVNDDYVLDTLNSCSTQS